jgi:hypothetical protein
MIPLLPISLIMNLIGRKDIKQGSNGDADVWPGVEIKKAFNMVL